MSSSSKNHTHKEKNKNLKYNKLASRDKSGNSDKSEEIIKKILKAIKKTVTLLQKYFFNFSIKAIIIKNNASKEIIKSPVNGPINIAIGDR